MSKTFDLNLLPLSRSQSGPVDEWEAAIVAEPPRRAIRSRRNDRLVLYLHLSGNAPLSGPQQKQILSRLAQTYYKNGGSVTSGLRNLAEAMNQFLLDRNLKNASSGRQAVGLLTLVVVRNDHLYMSQSGPVHAFLIQQQETTHVFDPQISGRGLGLSRTPTIRFYRADLHANDLLLLSAQPSATWTEGTLRGIHGHSLESLRRRLMHGRDAELDALLIHFRFGSGAVHWVKRSTAPASTEPEEIYQPLPSLEEIEDITEGSPDKLEEPVATDADMPVLEVPDEPPSLPGVGLPEREAPPEEGSTAELQEPAGSPVFDEVEGLPVEEEGAQEEEPEPKRRQFWPFRGRKQAAPVKEGEPREEAVAAPEEETPLVEARLATEAPPETDSVPLQSKSISAPAVVVEGESEGEKQDVQAKRSRPKTGPFFTALALIARAFLTAGRWFAELLRTILQRMLPQESMMRLPVPVMAFFAIAVPLIVVSVASVVYVQEGRTAQYEALFARAQLTATQAGEVTDPTMERIVWLTTLDYLDQADAYSLSFTPESRQLREQARASLDALDLIRRANYQSALLGGLPENVNITRIIAAEDDLYLLDGASGHVIRGKLTANQRYEIDPEFACGPSAAQGFFGGPLVDIAPAPQGSNTAVIGINSSGQAMYCRVGENPEVVELGIPATAPNWGSLMGFALDRDLGHIYVLDPLDRAVWAYWRAELENEPTFFFAEEVPSIQDVIDMTVDDWDLYLLHAGGQVTLCTYSQITTSPTRCLDNAAFIDARPGREGQPMELENAFAQIFATQPPEPSLYLLEPQARAIYHFSLRTLNFHRQYRPEDDNLSGDATAFAVDNVQRRLFIAIGNDVYQAGMP